MPKPQVKGALISFLGRVGRFVFHLVRRFFRPLLMHWWAAVRRPAEVAQSQARMQAQA